MANDERSDLDAFLELSGYLLGLPLPGLESLDRTLGQTYLERLRQYLEDSDEIDSIIGSAAAPAMGPASLAAPQPSPRTLTDLLEIWRRVGPEQESFDREVFLDDARPDLSAVAQKILILWYSAQINNIPLDATTYDRALVWSISYAHPQGVPRSFGYWQYSPEAVGRHDPPGLGGKGR